MSACLYIGKYPLNVKIINNIGMTYTYAYSQSIKVIIKIEIRVDLKLHYNHYK